jgi:hypothetical protein
MIGAVIMSITLLNRLWGNIINDGATIDSVPTQNTILINDGVRNYQN